MSLAPSRFWVIPCICLLITFYFFFHAVQGGRGIRRMEQLNAEIAQARVIAAETVKERQLLQTKVDSLSPKSLDLDQLEESAHRLLNMGEAEDKVIFVK